MIVLDLYLTERRVLEDYDPRVLAASDLLNRLPIHPQAGNDGFRTPDAVVLKLANFRSYDPDTPARGMTNAGRRAEELWHAFWREPETVHQLAGAVELAAQDTSRHELTQPEPDEDLVLEGRLLYRRHRQRERDPRLRARKLKRLAEGAASRHAKSAASCPRVCSVRAAARFSNATTYGRSPSGSEPRASLTWLSSAPTVIALSMPSVYLPVSKTSARTSLRRFAARWLMVCSRSSHSAAALRSSSRDLLGMMESDHACDSSRVVSLSPPPASSRVSARMAGYRQRDTQPELALRSALHARGLRYFVDRPPLPKLRRRADLVFPRARVAVYVHGCFWHGCSEHGTWPAHNAAWWRAKIESNRARDRDTAERLSQAGWIALEVWEHEDALEAAGRVEEAVRVRQPSLNRRRDEDSDSVADMYAR